MAAIPISSINTPTKLIVDEGTVRVFHPTAVSHTGSVHPFKSINAGTWIEGGTSPSRIIEVLAVALAILGHGVPGEALVAVATAFVVACSRGIGDSLTSFLSIVGIGFVEANTGAAVPGVEVDAGQAGAVQHVGVDPGPSDRRAVPLAVAAVPEEAFRALTIRKSHSRTVCVGNLRTVRPTGENVLVPIVIPHTFAGAHTGRPSRERESAAVHAFVVSHHLFALHSIPIIAISAKAAARAIWTGCVWNGGTVDHHSMTWVIHPFVARHTVTGCRSVAAVSVRNGWAVDRNGYRSAGSIGPLVPIYTITGWRAVISGRVVHGRTVDEFPTLSVFPDEPILASASFRPCLSSRIL